MNTVLYTVGPYWFLFLLAGYWMMFDNIKVFQNAGYGVLVISSLFGLNDYASSQIVTWEWWEQSLVFSSVLTCLFLGIVCNRITQNKL